MPKKTLKEDVINLLKKGWYSNLQINVELKSGSADRIMRFVREKPPTGYKIEQRKKNLPKELGYRNCLEYTLIEVGA